MNFFSCKLIFLEYLPVLILKSLFLFDFLSEIF